MDLLPDAAASQERLGLLILRRPTELDKRNRLAFDEMDFNVLSRRDWTRFHESRAQHVRVHLPDGYFTDGPEVHIKDMDVVFVHAPDPRIAMHPMRRAQDEWTALTGVMRGTFSEQFPTAKVASFNRRAKTSPSTWPPSPDGTTKGPRRRSPFCQHGLRHLQSLPSLKGETDQVDSDDHANHADAART